MKVKAVILIFLFLFSAAGASMRAQAQEYGEDSTALGQFVDDFENLDNVSVAVEVERNSTLNAMELNLTGVIQSYENISSFTEVDVGPDYITLTDSTAQWNNMIRNVDVRAWRDYGVNFFDDFYFEFKIGMTNVEAGDGTSNAMVLPIAIHNSAGDFNNIWAGTSLMIYASQQTSLDDKYNYWLLARKGGGTISDASAFLPLGEYYVIMNRTGADVDALFFTDFERTILSFKLSIAAWADDLRYMSLAVSRNAASDPNDHSSGFIQNITFDPPGGYSEIGYFTTVDYLGDPLANGSILVQMTSATIPANTGITVQFSDDNSTWVNSEGEAGYNDLTDGLFSIDLRELNWSTIYHLRYNLSTTDSTITPRLNQSRLITTLGNDSIRTEFQDSAGDWIEYNLTEFNASVGTVDAGLLSSTFFIDGITFDVSEVVGVPGMMLSGNFTGVDENAISIWLLIYAHYDGNLNHDFDIEVWDFEGSAWIEDDHITDGVALEYFNSTIYRLRIPARFLRNGEVRIRLDHESAGNINHDLFIDQIQLQAFIPIDEPFQFFWIVIGIALMLIGIVLSKMWFDGKDP